jgi:hypothetical protein
LEHVIGVARPSDRSRRAIRLHLCVCCAVPDDARVVFVEEEAPLRRCGISSYEYFRCDRTGTELEPPCGSEEFGDRNQRRPHGNEQTSSERAPVALLVGAQSHNEDMEHNTASAFTPAEMRAPRPAHTLVTVDAIRAFVPVICEEGLMQKRRVPFVAARRRRGFYRSLCLGLIAAVVQLIVACGGSGSEDAAVMPAVGGQMAGSDSGNNATTHAGVGGAAGQAAVGGNGLGGAVPDPAPAAGASGAADVFVPAPHQPFPLLIAHGGPVIQKIELVPVYFGTDPLQAELESFNTWIVSSNYWKTLGADYGVLPGKRLPAVQFARAPTSPISDVQIANWLDAQIANGSLPKPSAQTLFALFYPAGTTITTNGSTSCSEFAGLHPSASIANGVFTGEVPFVVIPRCSFSAGDELTIATNVASHEYIEAATDPLAKSNPAWLLDGKEGQPLEAWQMLNGLEVGDLCENQSYDVSEGFTVQDSWSNSAAQAGNNPCQPSDAQHPFFMVSAGDTIYHAKPGATVTMHARAWSNMRAPDWTCGVNWGYTPASDFDGHAALSRTTVNNGDDVIVTITVPPNPPVVGGRSVYRFTVDSIDPINPNFYHPWPVMIVVP